VTTPPGGGLLLSYLATKETGTIASFAAMDKEAAPPVRLFSPISGHEKVQQDRKPLLLQQLAYDLTLLAWKTVRETVRSAGGCAIRRNRIKNLGSGSAAPSLVVTTTGAWSTRS
jgi:hypothetical protein